MVFSKQLANFNIFTAKKYEIPSILFLNFGVKNDLAITGYRKCVTMHLDDTIS
jgi:hypothetical protein